MAPPLPEAPNVGFQLSQAGKTARTQFQDAEGRSVPIICPPSCLLSPNASTHMVALLMAPKAVAAVAAHAFMPALGRQRREVSKFEASLICSEKPCLKRERREGGRENNRFQTDALVL